MVRAAGWLLVAALASGCATDNTLGSSSEIGKVQGVFVEEYNGIFVDRQALEEHAGKPLWVYVTFDEAIEDGRRFAIARLEQDPGIETGDLVQLRLAHDGAVEGDTVPHYNQVIALVAKHDTVKARTFGSQTSLTGQLRQATVEIHP